MWPRQKQRAQRSIDKGCFSLAPHISPLCYLPKSAKRFVIEHEDNLIFDLLSQLLALAWHDGIFAPEIREIEDICTHPIPPHRRGMELKIDREWLDVPIFREPERTADGYWTSRSKPLKSANWNRNLKRTGERAGEEENLTQKVLRRGGINAINSMMRPPTLSGGVADEVTGHRQGSGIGSRPSC
jgi:hypothetical protein